MVLMWAAGHLLPGVLAEKQSGTSSLPEWTPFSFCVINSSSG